MKFKFFITTTIAYLFFGYLIGQENVTSLSFKKGEVLDIILATGKPDSDIAFDRYKKTAFPVALEYSYSFRPSFKISQRIFGSSSPQQLIFGSWTSLEKREGFISDITSRVPDFHEQRLNTFSHFNLTYYEMSEDITFSLKKDKTNVVTSFWKNDNNSLSNFIATWKKSINSNGGKIALKLIDGKSPTGYSYNPDVLIITEWETRADFEKFMRTYPLAHYQVLKNVEQFIIE